MLPCRTSLSARGCMLCVPRAGRRKLMTSRFLLSKTPATQRGFRKFISHDHKVLPVPQSMVCHCPFSFSNGVHCRGSTSCPTLCISVTLSCIFFRVDEIGAMETNMHASLQALSSLLVVLYLRQTVVIVSGDVAGG